MAVSGSRFGSVKREENVITNFNVFVLLGKKENLLCQNNSGVGEGEAAIFCSALSPFQF